MVRSHPRHLQCSRGCTYCIPRGRNTTTIFLPLSPSAYYRGTGCAIARDTPRGGVFAKIPGLDQRLTVEARRANEPPKFNAPNLLSGTVRMYDAEVASNAAFR